MDSVRVSVMVILAV